MSNIDQRVSDNQYNEYLPATAAAELLGVKLATLYAYTSRGLVSSVPGPKGRARLYLRRDLERLRARRDARAGHGPVAAAALQFGEPVLDSSITAIAWDRGPIYRGVSALDLAESDTSFESVAELLWSGSRPDDEQSHRVSYLWSAIDFGMPIAPLRDLVTGSLPPLAALSLVVPLLGSRDPGRFATRPEAVLPRARSLIRRMVAALALGRDDDDIEPAMAAALEAETLAGAVITALGSEGDSQGAVAVNRALVLGADHELNASTFAARIAASTGADIYACVTAALATLSGPRHGGAADRIEALLDEIDTPEEAIRVVHERQRRGEGVEGFGHALYPEGDPRGAALLRLADEVAPGDASVSRCSALVAAMAESGQGGATIDVGLVALSLALGLPRGAAVGLFAVSRCVGWVAHALEQYEAGYLLRPRARYMAAGQHGS
jgi:citrate synthase